MKGNGLDIYVMKIMWFVGSAATYKNGTCYISIYSYIKLIGIKLVRSVVFHLTLLIKKHFQSNKIKYARATI